VEKNKATILVIDDDADIRELIKILLESDGYEVNIASDGVEALEQLRSGPLPGLIILDLMMPRIDGEEFMKQVRQPRYGHIPVVVMSGYNAAQKQARELDADSCLMKPIEVEELFKTVKQYTTKNTRDAA
jgi:chemosensory pili system protein ChpA (sensor histidine kinase/response regulator)